jgi:hypothetical protein
MTLPEAEAEAEAEPWGRARRRFPPEAEAEAEPWGRARRSFLLRPRLNSLSVSPGWLAQQLEWGGRRCFPVRSVSEMAK